MKYRAFIINKNTTESIFQQYLSQWDAESISTVALEFADEEVKERYNILDMALKYAPNSFAEAVIDLFLEMEELPISDDRLMICLDGGSIGLKWSVHYRHNKSEYISELCAGLLKDV